MSEAGLYKAKAVATGSYTNLKIGDYVEGYYVKCRNRHYILQQYNDAGYDERWEAHEWIEVDVKTLESVSPAASPVSDAVELTAVILELEQAHTLLAKSELSREEYQQISPLLASSKLKLFSICNKSSPTPTNVQEQDELWVDVGDTILNGDLDEPETIKILKSKYTITKKPNQ